MLRALKDPFLIAQDFKEKEDKNLTKTEDLSLDFMQMSQVSILMEHLYLDFLKAKVWIKRNY